MKNLKYIAKAFKYTLLSLVVILSLSSCEREMEEEIISVTPPELHVVVHTGADKSARVEGATVQLYATTADRESGQNMVAVAMTNNKGEAMFAKADFVKGVNYLSVSKDGTTVTADTPYLLQNDGKTLFWVSKN